MSKIIGVTVGTPTSPKKIENEIKPVKTVNGQEPDENGNVEVVGNNGTDGISPTISVSTITGGHRITITDKDGTKNVDVMDGEDGADGKTPVKDVDYFDGKDGTSVTVSSVTESTASGGSNIVNFSDGKKVTIKNGKDGNDYILTETDKNEIAANVKSVCVAKNQGANNVGKFLAVGTDGNLILIDMPNGDIVGTIDENNNILLTGLLANGDYTVKYEKEDGSYTDIGTLTVGDTPKYTNLAEPLPDNTTDTTKWVNGYRITSSTIGAQAGTTVSNTIACTNGDVIRIKGVSLRAGTDRIVAYAKEFTTNDWAAGYFNIGIQLGSLEIVSKCETPDANGVYTFNITTDKTKTITGLRFAMPTPADASAVIITKNEEIA